MLRSRTYYGLTDERVIIISGLSSWTVKSLQVQTLTDVSLSEEASGIGAVTFGPNVGRNPQPSFESIAGAREVFERICSVRREAIGGAAFFRRPRSLEGGGRSGRYRMAATRLV